MAKIRPASGKQKKSGKGNITENLRALPCLLVVILAMLLLFYIFFLALQGN